MQYTIPALFEISSASAEMHPSERLGNCQRLGSNLRVQCTSSRGFQTCNASFRKTSNLAASAEIGSILPAGAKMDRFRELEPLTMPRLGPAHALHRFGGPRNLVLALE